jgi:hypothetical protein
MTEEEGRYGTEIKLEKIEINQEEIDQWRKSHRSGMTCIKCDKKIYVEKYHKDFHQIEDPCKCVSPIKVDMNVVDHRMVTEMTYLVQKNKVSGEYGNTEYDLISLKGFPVQIEKVDPATLPDKKVFHEKDGILTTAPEPEKKPEKVVYGDMRSRSYDDNGDVRVDAYPGALECPPSLIGKEVEDEPYVKFFPAEDPNMKPIPPTSPSYSSDPDYWTRMRKARDFNKFISDTIGLLAEWADEISTEDDEDIDIVIGELGFIERKLRHTDIEYKIRFVDQYLNEQD